MSDPLERLSALRGGLDGTAMPPAAELRRRGERRRTRARAAAATAGLALVAAVLAPVLDLVPGDHRGDPPPASPSVTSSESATAAPAPAPDVLTGADLLSDAETVYHDDPQGSDWYATATHTVVPPQAVHPCARQALSRLGSLQELQRVYELRAGTSPDRSPENWMVETVARFGDAAAAREAYETLTAWVTDCRGPVTDYRVHGPTEVETGVGGEARVYFSTEGVGTLPGDPEFANMIETGLVLVDDRVAVITSSVVGMDYNFLDGTPVERMVPAAARLLLPGG